MNPYATTSIPPAAGSPDSLTKLSWSEAEPGLRVALGRATARLLRRSTASWPIWTALVMALASGALFFRIRHPPPFTTTLVFRLAEGAIPVAPQALSSRALRAYIFDLALSRRNLTPLAEQEEASSAKAGDRNRKPADIGEAVTEILDATSVTIGESDFIEDRTAGDPPRVVRIELTFRSQSPDKSWTMAHALANLMVSSERDRRVRDLEHQAAGSEAALDGASAPPTTTTTTAPAHQPAGEPEPGQGTRQETRPDSRPDIVAPSTGVSEEVEQRDSAQTWLARRSLASNESLRFELTDPGRHPSDQFRSVGSLLASILLALPFLLLGAALLAGAMDPRVLDVDDLTAMGIVVLGRAQPTRRV